MSTRKSPPEAAEALRIARDVVREAGELLRGSQGNIRAIRSKSNLRDLVTEWDTRSEESTLLTVCPFTVSPWLSRSMAVRLPLPPRRRRLAGNSTPGVVAERS